MKASAKFKITELNFRKNVDPSLRRGTNKQLLELDQLKVEYKQCQEEADVVEDQLEIEKQKLQELNSIVEKLRNQLATAQEEIDADYLPEGAQPRPRIHFRDRIALEVRQAETALDAQRNSTQQASERFMEAESKLFQADRNINRFAETLEDTMLAMSTIKDLDKEKAQKLSNLAQRVEKQKAMEKKAIEEAKEAQAKELQDLKTKQMKISKQLHKEASQKLSQSHLLTRETASKVKDMSDAEQRERAEAVLELKANQNAVRDQMITMADRHKKKVDAAKKQLEDEKEAILARGLNPYIEFRRKEFEEEAEKREKKMREAVEQNKVELAGRMKREEQFFEKQAKAKRVEQEYEKKHRDSQGRHVGEEKNAHYIASRTSSHLEILDPSGKASRVDPSQITDIADYSFGLGKSARIPADTMKRITGQIRENLKIEKDELGEYKRLVSGLLKKVDESNSNNNESDKSNKLRSGSAPTTSLTSVLEGDGDDFDGDYNNNSSKDFSHLESLANQPGLMPGADKAATTVNFSGDLVEKASLLRIVLEEEGEANDGTAGISSAKKPKYPVVQLSKFERDSLDRAGDRHRGRIEMGTEQIAGGKTFKGHAFVSKPEELLFLDFEVGKKYKKHFTLTNVSYTFNSFKLLDLSDDVTDFFAITFDKPGRMSAGVSCSLEIVFTPQVNKDIVTKIHFFTETGPVEVPLKCLIRRCAPRIINPSVDFGSVVVGQKVTIPMKIRNTQALGSRFQVIPYRDGGQQGVLSSEENTSVVVVEGEEQKTNEDVVVKEEEEDNIDMDMDEPINTSVDPAQSETELDMRVQRVVTQVWRRKKRDNPYPLSSMRAEGLLDGYGNASVDLLCAPLTVGPIEQKFSVVFDGVDESFGTVDDLGEVVTKEQVVIVSTVGEEVPIYMAEEVMDFRCTMSDRIYRKKITVKNRAKAAYRVIVKVANKFSKYVEVTPNMFFVQAKSSQSINVKFTPLNDLLSTLPYFSLPYELFHNSAFFTLPIELEAVNQELPIFFLLKASVCPSTIQLSCSTLDFGKVYVGQKSVKRLTLKNTSMLPQKIAFVRLRKEFVVTPNEGFAVLLPNEEMDFDISFGPMSGIEYDLLLSLLTSSNDSYDIKVIAEGVNPPLDFSTSVVKMRTTAPGERVVESAMVTNRTSHPQTFEVLLPPKAFTWLSVSPTVVSLQPGQTARLELEFVPPADAVDLEPSQWYQSLTEISNSNNNNPFDEWVSDSGWDFGRGMFGELQWYKPKPVIKKIEEMVGEEEALVPPPSDVVVVAEEVLSIEQQEQQEKQELHCNLPEEEWGVNGTWDLPVMVRNRRRATGTSPTKTQQHSSTPLPLYLSVHTTVKLPAIDSDTKIVDFGQISVGIRQIKTFRIYNKTHSPLRLQSIGLNAVGPFTLVRPIKEIAARESQIVIVECLPLLPGLVVELLEISAVDESLVGHRIRVSMRVQGLKPSILLEGLQSPPPNWNPRCGILDFQDCLMLDTVVKKFVIRNKSTFAIDAKLVRIVGMGLTPSQQAELIERTSTGLPVWSFSPERVVIPEGGAAEVEVVFRPDRGRFHPFREDIDIVIGKTDEIYRVGIFGRSWSRQLLVRPSDPRDEAFNNNNFAGLSQVEDPLFAHASIAVRTIALESRESLKLRFPEMPVLTLEFPDPFAVDADPNSFVETGNNNNNVGGKGGKGGGAVVSAPGARQQTKKLTLSSAKVFDNRPGLSAGTFEVILSQEAKNSGLFSVSVDKGNIALNAADVVIDVVCTLPKPRSLGGMFVDSWKVYKMEVLMKGGWRSSDEKEENRVQVSLKAYVSL